MDGVPYDPARCLTCWFRLIQAPHLAWPLSAGVRVERLDCSSRWDGETTTTYPQEILWPAVPVRDEDCVFEVKASVPVPIVSLDQVLFLTVRDAVDRVVARVHLTYADARALRRGGFSEWYAAEPAPLEEGIHSEEHRRMDHAAFDQLARDERTTFRLVHYLDDGDLFAVPINFIPASHPSRVLTSNDVDRECLRWLSEVSRDDPTELLLAGAFRLPVQALLFDTDEPSDKTIDRTAKYVRDGTYLADILFGPCRIIDHDRLFVACEYASGNMCALDVPSLADRDDYTRLAFPDGSEAVHRTAIDKAGARLAVLRRLNLSGWHPAVIMTSISGRRYIEAGMVANEHGPSGTLQTVVILSERRCSTILLVAWRKQFVPHANGVDICTQWQHQYRCRRISKFSEVWIRDPTHSVTPPHTYRCDLTKWTEIFLPALLATTPRRLTPHFCSEAINQIASAVSRRRARGETGGYVPLGFDSEKSPRHATAVAVQRGFDNAVVPGLAAARQERGQKWRYAAFW